MNNTDQKLQIEDVAVRLFRITKQKPSKLPNGVMLPHREKFPSPREFGKTGWFYMKKSRALAFAHFRRLVGKYGDNIPLIRLSPKYEGTTHFEDEDDLNRGWYHQTAIRVEELLNRKIGRFLNHRSVKMEFGSLTQASLGGVSKIPTERTG